MASAPRVSTASTEMLRFILIALGVITILTGVAMALLTGMTAFMGGGGPVGPAILTALGIAIGAGVMAVVLFWLSSVLRMLAAQVQQGHLNQTTLETVQSSLLRVEQAIREAPAGGATGGYVAAPAAPVAPQSAGAADEVAQATTAQMLDLLQQIRDVTMMSDAQRQLWSSRHWTKKKEFITRLIERNITTGEWAVAFARMEELKALLPEDAEIQALGQRLVEEQSARLKDDITAARTQLRHLMSITAWAQAEEVAAALLNKYPHEAEVQAVTADVQRERAAFEQENMQRLFLDLHDSTEHRQWMRAIQVAEELVRRYPYEKRVEKLRKDLPTIKENAESQERKEQEDLFKDLLNRQRYEEAAGVAKGVIGKHPNSQAAQQLMKLLPKVEELIKQEKLKKQQTGTPVV
jgi:hypothetical protein